MDGVKVTPTTRTATPAMTIVPTTGEVTTLYRCDDCKALLLNKEDARDHLWWHDTLVRMPEFNQ